MSAEEKAAPGPARAAAVEVVRTVLSGSGLEWETTGGGNFVVTLPGERKLRTTCSLIVGEHSLSINVFVVRRPDENHEAVYRWLLERNAKSYLVTFALDHLGDVYLVGRLPLAAVTADELDLVLGSVLEQADGAFNTLLELGFAGAIRKEWDWRTRRGESTANLAAFRHLVELPADRDGEPG